jgi:Cobalamin biosynthesis protein CbiD
VSVPEASAETVLRRGWTTGACAAAAARAAYTALLGGEFPDPVTIELPGGERPAFALATTFSTEALARVGIVKDAGDDPDVTHGALVVVTLSRGKPTSGVVFQAGDGVGTVTRPGLALAPNEPAINPTPRAMIRKEIADVAKAFGASGDVVVEISIPGGVLLAERTLNGRLGIVGGLSILGTTGIVIPYSCSAWIHSIHRGIDVARAMGFRHVAGATGSTSEAAVRSLHDLPDVALIDMGDFVGGMLKYLRVHPIDKVTIAGGFAKNDEARAGSSRLAFQKGAVDFEWLGVQVAELGGSKALVAAVRSANTAVEVCDLAAEAGLALSQRVADAALATAREVVRQRPVSLEVVIFDRAGQLLARTPI